MPKDTENSTPHGAPTAADLDDRYELIARGSHDGIWDLDLVTGDMYVSERWMEVAGVTEAPTTLDGWVDLIHPDDRALASEAAAAHVSGATKHLEVEVRLDGDALNTHWVLLRGLADSNDPPQRMAGSITDTSDAHNAELTLRHQALHDPLTGLPNRTFLLEELNRHVARELRDPGPRIALLFLDLVGFKAVNDHFGHDAGDEVLRVIGRRLRFATRPEDLPTRLGGDEFVVVMAGLDEPETALQVADRLIELLRKPITVHGHEHEIVPSAGLVVTTDHQWSPELLIRAADTAMYRAKRRGSEHVEVHVLVEAERDTDLQSDLSLESAARQGRLLMHYQPIVVAEGRRIVGFEALLRWRRQGRGVVSAYGEGIGINPQLDRLLSRWALEHAIEDAAAAIARGIDIPMLAVNISRTHLVDPGLVGSIDQQLQRHGLDPAWLHLEISAEAVDGLDLSALDPLRRLGVKFHLDCFGVHESSLHTLHSVNPVAVKLDPRLVSAMLDDIVVSRLVRSICAAANVSGVNVVAVGVELPAAAQVLREAGCTLVQGSLYGAPELPTSAFNPSGTQERMTSVSASLL